MNTGQIVAASIIYVAMIVFSAIFVVAAVLARSSDQPM